MEAGTYQLLIQHVSGSAVRVDYIEFLPTTPVEASSWGRLKQLYR